VDHVVVEIVAGAEHAVESHHGPRHRHCAHHAHWDTTNKGREGGEEEREGKSVEAQLWLVKRALPLLFSPSLPPALVPRTT